MSIKSTWTPNYSQTSNDQKRYSPDAYKDLFRDRKLKSLFIASFREAYKQGAKGVTKDALLAYAEPWGFKLEDIKFQNIYFYNGKLDLSVPISMGEKMSKAIVNSKLKIYPNDGHLSILANQMREIEKDFFEV